MEASALQLSVGLTRQRSRIGVAILRLRTDEQLVELMRAGHEEAFHAIHERYRQRLFVYMRQMLPQRQDAEDALQEVFERAYASLRFGDRELALRPWLYRIAHNRCIDQLRRPLPPPPEAMLQLGLPPADPALEADRRESLRRLMEDVRRLPEQQRSALFMRELGGISYAEVALALGVTVPAVKSLLVRARISLAQAAQARDTACEEIRAELVLAHDGRSRPGAMARRHLRDCAGCRAFRGDLHGVRRQLRALAPPVGLLAAAARIIGGGGGAAAGGSAASGIAGTGASGVAGSTGLFTSAGALAASAGHVATIIAATVVTAGGAAVLEPTLAATLRHHAEHRAPAPHRLAASPVTSIPAPDAATTTRGTPTVYSSPAPAPATSRASTPAPVRPMSAASGPARLRAVHHPAAAALGAAALEPLPDPTAQQALAAIPPASAPPTAADGGQPAASPGGTTPLPAGTGPTGAGTATGTVTGGGATGTGTATSGPASTGSGSTSGTPVAGTASAGSGSSTGTGGPPT